MSLKRSQGGAVPRFLGNIVDDAKPDLKAESDAACNSLKRPRKLGVRNAPPPPPPPPPAAAVGGSLPASSSHASRAGSVANMGNASTDSIEHSLQNVFFRLCFHLVNWDFARDFASRDALSAAAVAASAAHPLPLVYSAVEEYVGRWEPALVEEIKANIVSNMAARPLLEAIAVDASAVASESTRPVHEITTVLCKNVNSTSDGSKQTLLAQPPVGLGNKQGGLSRLSDLGSMDLVVISLEPLGGSGLGAPSGISRPGRVAVPGIVSGVEGRGANAVVSVQVGRARWQELSALIRMGSSSNERTMHQLYVTPLTSLVSQWREFMSVVEFRHVALCKYILWGGDPVHLAQRPPPLKRLKASSNAPNPPSDEGKKASSSVDAEGAITVRKELSHAIIEWLESNFNKSQVNAILGAASAVEYVMKDLRPASVAPRASSQKPSSSAEAVVGAVDSHLPFTLIQGPPGTGKTSTLLGLLNLLHHKEYLVYFDNIIAKILSDEGLSCRNRHVRSHITTDAPVLNTLGSDANSVDVTKSPFVLLAMNLAKLKPRILVTAPSNIAIDNIIQRIMGRGFVDGNGGTYYPNILRIGAGYTNDSIQAVTLEGSLEKILSASDKSLRETLERTKCGMVDQLRELFHLQTLLLNLRMAFNSFTSAPTINEDEHASMPLPRGWELRVAFDTAEPYWVNHIKKTTQPVPPQRNEDQDIQNASLANDTWPVYSNFEALPEFIIYASRLVNLVEALESNFLTCKRITLYLNRREISLSSGGSQDFFNSSSSPKQIIEGSILDGAHIVLTTLNGSGHPSMEKTVPFPVLVVDEAGQCTEPSVLIPMRRGCRHCILVGDPMQLPATTFSPLSKSIKYDRSLLERLMQIGCDYHMLDIQYRMDPQILAFPNAEFYHGRIKSGDNVRVPSFRPEYVAAAGLEPFTFFDLRSSSEVQCGASKSRKNVEEALFTVRLIQYIASFAPRPDEDKSPAARVSVGVISPYMEQVQELQRLLSQSAIVDECKSVLDITVNTVDGFQGREMDFILFSCVRSNDSGGIGFLSDIRRLNVALTRARFCLMLVGHAPTLCRHHDTWMRLVDHAVRSNVMIDVAHSGQSISRILGLYTEHHQDPSHLVPPLGMQSDFIPPCHRNYSTSDGGMGGLSVPPREDLTTDRCYDAIEEGEIFD